MAIPIIVEDGGMPDGANSYASIEDADAYLAARGVSAWEGKDEDAKAVILIRAADVLNGYRWKGNQAAHGRVMAWPRKGVRYDDKENTEVPDNDVPQAVIHAQCELAGAIADGSTPLAPVDTATGPVTSEKADVIAVTYGDPEKNAYTGVTGFPAVDGMLYPFLRHNSGEFGMVPLRRG